VVWDRARARDRKADARHDQPEPLRTAGTTFYDVLEEAPVIALLLDQGHRVQAANAAARRFFRLATSDLPLGLLDATREGRLLEALHSGSTQGEVRLTHSQRSVHVCVAPGLALGESLLFLTDTTELRRLETVRQEFVANLSHELKTPLTSLRLAVESLQQDRQPPPAARRRFAARALAETDHVASIVANLRELAQIEAGQAALTLSEFSIRDLVTEAAFRLRLDRPLQLHIADDLRVTADRAKLAQVLDNLLDNASRFSPPGLPIEIDASVVEAQLQLEVRDHGPGISPEHWPRVFERFYKVDPSRSRAGPAGEGSRAMGGSGLGLAITKHLVLAHGGRVWTQAADGGGQVFGFAIPMPAEPAP
jgi:two-component system phosphate regulon sensor histidine kinase PhoR